MVVILYTVKHQIMTTSRHLVHDVLCDALRGRPVRAQPAVFASGAYGVLVELVCIALTSDFTHVCGRRILCALYTASTFMSGNTYFYVPLPLRLGA